MSEAKEGEGVKEDFSECPEKEGAEKPGDSEMEAVGLVESPTAKDSPPGAEPELEAAAVACYRNGVSGGDTGIDGDASPTSQSDNYGELKERANEEHVSVFKECSNEQANAETAEDVARLDEKLNEQGDNEKGDDAGEFSELMGKQVNAESENDAGEFNDNASAQAETNSGEDADELKEILGGEAILGDEEDTLSEQGKTENMVHDGEAIEDVKENAKIKTEEVIVKNMDIGDEKVVQTKEDCHVNLPLAEYKISTEHPGKVNGTAKSLPFDFNSLDGDDAGTEEEQAAFMNELENFFKERSLDFKPPKFYGEGLNCLKLWRGVIRLGGYDQVTLCKLWRQVGESFKPPKTCTTVSWSFRIFYEKALLDYERHKVQTGELQVAAPPLSDPAGAENQVGGNQVIGSGRARRESAARAMQGWHSQGLVGSGEEKSSATLPKREKQLKTLSVPKRKKPSSEEQAVKVARTDVNVSRDGQASSPVLKTEITIADVGPVAEWVKINVRRNKDCFEVYALVPGLLREEVRVQSDPAGRLVISGEPEQPDNPWGVTPFKKVINLPARINPQQTSAVVTLHGQLFVRAPFE